MKYFLLLAIILTSLCIEIPFLSSSNTTSNVLTSGTIQISNEEICVNVNALPTDISAGGNVTLVFEVISKANYNLTDVILDLYDPCVFNTGEWY